MFFIVVTINCPDKAGLGCDLLRTVLEFGLYVTRGDFQTDGKWCYIVLWLVPRPSSLEIDWQSLKSRLLAVCPSCQISFYFNEQPSGSPPSPVYLLKVFCLDRKGLLHDATKVLCELELVIQRVKVMTTPEGKVLDLFFITDSLNLLHTKERRVRTCEKLEIAQGEYCISVELIQCIDQKGLVYDILRTIKDFDIQIAYGRISPIEKGCRNVDLFVQTADGKKITDQESQVVLCSRLKEEMLHPLRVTVTSRGPDTELLVVNPVERICSVVCILLISAFFFVFKDCMI